MTSISIMVTQELPTSSRTRSKTRSQSKPKPKPKTKTKTKTKSLVNSNSKPSSKSTKSKPKSKSSFNAPTPVVTRNGHVTNNGKPSKVSERSSVSPVPSAASLLNGKRGAGITAPKGLSGPVKTNHAAAKARKRKRHDADASTSGPTLTLEEHRQRILEEEAHDDRSEVKVHRCRFIDFKPEAIHVLSRESPNSALVAVGRDGGSIEIWSLETGWQKRYTIPGRAASGESSGGESRIRDLVWKGSQRLFGAGLDGAVFEVDMHRLGYKQEVDSFGGAVWALDLNSTGEVLAAGCEDGRIRLFDVAGEDSLEYLRALTYGSTGRLLALKWHPEVEDVLFTGGVDGILRRWDASTGNVQAQFVMETFGNAQPAVVWAMSVLPDEVLVVGDSMGRVQFWDVDEDTGSLLQTFHEHKADVLALTASQDGKHVFASGVDSRVAKFSYEESTRKWVYAYSHRPHTHDVLSLQTMQYNGDEIVISGGLDTQICFVQSVEKFATLRPIKLSPFSHSQQQVQVSNKLGNGLGENQFWLLMVQHARHVELFKLPVEVNSNRPIEKFASPHHKMVVRRHNHLESPEKLVALYFKNRLILRSSSLSQDGKFVAASDDNGLKLFRVDTKSGGSEANSGSHALVRLTIEPEFKSGDGVPVHIRFCGGLKEKSLCLVCVMQSGVTHILQSLSKDGTFSKALRLERPKEVATACTNVRASPDSKWLALHFFQYDMLIYSLETGSLHAHVPRGSMDGAEASTFEFHCHKEEVHLITACDNNKFYVYDVVQKCMTDWTKANIHRFPTKKLVKSPYRVQGICLERESGSSLQRVAIWSSGFVCFADTTLPLLLDDSEQNKPREAKTKAEETRLQFNHMYRPVVHMQQLGPKEIVVVEAPWLKVMRHFPNVLYRKRYGGK